MDREQAIRAMLDGKKLTRKGFTYEYIHFSRSGFRYDNKDLFDPNEIFDYEWEIYIPEITYTEAMKALFNGERVRCKWNELIYFMVSGSVQYKDGNSVLRKQMFESKWEIVND